MKQLKALYLANAREFLREPMAVLLILLLPVALMVFFGLIFNGGGGDWTLQLGVVNEDVGPGGEQMVAGLEALGAENVLGLHTGTRAEMLEALETGRVSVMLVLPADMSALLGKGEPATVEVFYDPTSSTSAGAGLGMVHNILSEANLALSDSPRLLLMEEKSVHTDPLRPIDSQLPGLLGIALLWLGIFGTAMPLVQQRVTQVLRRLSVTPLTPARMLAAQVAWRVTVGLLQMVLFLLVGYLAFGVGVEGNKLLFASAVLLGTLVCVSLGYVMAGLAASEEAVMALSQMVNFPMMFLSGGLFPVESLPAYFKPVVAIMPLTYLTDALRQLMVGATPLHPLWLDFAVLGGWLAVLLALAARFWRWE